VPEIPAFERDPRRTRLETAILRSGSDGGRSYVVLADTILYPEGGGQPADHGAIDGVSVVDVQKVDGEIRHFVDGMPPGLSGAACVDLDWRRRFDHMQQHSGQHLLTAIANERFGWPTTAFHLGETVSDIEVGAPEVDPDRLSELEEAVAAEIRASRPISARRVSPEEYTGMAVRSRGLPAGHTGSVRLVEIEGIDLNTCGGTHCATTGELEALKLLGTESVRGGTRIFYVAGARLRALLGTHHRRNAELRGLLGASDDGLPAAVAARIDQLKESQKALQALEDELATAAAQGLAARTEQVLVAHWADRTLPFLQKVARDLERMAPERVALLTCGAGEAGAFVVSAGEASPVDVREVGGRVAEVLGGRGGGSGRLFQGKATALSRIAEAAALLA
jgi:alanyl-tRNA synthetase